MRLVGLLGKRTGLERGVAASSGVQHQVNGQVEEAIVASRREESARWAPAMPAHAIPVAKDATGPGGLGLGALDPKRHSILWEQAAPAREQDTGQKLMEQALVGRNCRVMQSTSDEAPGLLAYGAQPLGAHHAPDLCHVPDALSKAIAAPMAVKQRAAAQAVAQAEAPRKRVHERLDNTDGEPAKRGPGRPPKAAASLEPVAQDVAGARHEPQRLTQQREQGAQRMRPIGHASHFVDLERGVRRPGKRMAGDIQAQIAPIRTVAQQASLSETCLEHLEKAARVVPTMQTTIACVSSSGRQQVRPLHVPPPPSDARQAHLIPACALARVASTRTRTAGEPLRALAERRRTPLFEPGGALCAFNAAEQDQRKTGAAKRADVWQRSSAKVEGRNGDLALRHHPLRGLDHPRKRTWLTAGHHFFLTRADGTTAAERFFGQTPRSMFAAILAAVAIPPAPLSPPQRAIG